jgi:tetratricopeptide (TPR) repeat protein
VHYLILGKEGRRLAQMSQFITLMDADVPMEQAFKQAFGMSFESMEKELREYIRQDRYPVVSGHFEQKLGFDTQFQTAPVSEAEAQAYLGDLLLHSNRTDSEAYLQKALELDPNLAMANASLGMLRVRQGKPDEARKSLERAVAANSQNYLIHYYYAFVLSREGGGDMQVVTGISPETAVTIRAELKKAIELRPDFPESYSLLAFVNLVTGSQLDESIELLKRALAASPGRQDLSFMLVQIYMRKEDYKTARQLLERLSANSGDTQIAPRAQALLGQISAIEEQLTRFRAGGNERWSESPEKSSLKNPAGMTEQPDAIDRSDPSSSLREALRKPAADETQVQGNLVRIDCDAKGITFVIKIDDRLLKLKTDSFEQLDLTSFSEDAGREVTCGPRKPQNNVVVCYVSSSDARAKFHGLLRSVEFVPKDFQLKPST